MATRPPLTLHDMRRKVAYAIFRSYTFGNNKTRRNCEQYAMELGIEDFRLGKQSGDIPKYFTYATKDTLSQKWQEGWDWAKKNGLPMLKGPSAKPYDAWGDLWEDSPNGNSSARKHDREPSATP